MHSGSINAMDNLPDFIGGLLGERGDTVAAFAARVGTSRQTVARWNTSLPSAETLRRVAADLEVPYSRVLVAALASAGYVETAADVLAGQDVHVVIGSDCDSCSGGTLAGAFSDGETAAEFSRVSHSIDPGMADFDSETRQIDSVSIPEAIEIHTNSWSSRSDQLRHSSTLVGERPARLIDRDVSDIEVSALGDEHQIYALTVSSIDDEAGRSALLRLLEQLRKDGKLLPADIDPLAGQGTSLITAEFIASQIRLYQDLYGDPSTRRTEPQFDALSIPEPTHQPLFGDTAVVGDRTYSVTYQGRAVVDNGPDAIAVHDVEKLPGFAGWRRSTPPLSPPMVANDSAERFRAAHLAAEIAQMPVIPYVWGGGNRPKTPPPPPRAIKRYTVPAPPPGQIDGIDDVII
jgi:transcriptional regulator with XRE-family HTH domain